LAALAPLAVLVVWIGVWPGFFTSRMAGEFDEIVGRAEEAWNRRTSQLLNGSLAADSAHRGSERAAHEGAAYAGTTSAESTASVPLAAAHAPQGAPPVSRPLAGGYRP
jgi:hypothetical protein